MAGSMERQLNQHWNPYPIRQDPQPGAMSPSKIELFWFLLFSVGSVCSLTVVSEPEQLAQRENP